MAAAYGEWGEQVAELRKAATKELEEIEAANQAHMKGIGDETASLLEKAKASELELQTIGLSAEQIAVLTARRYDEQIAIKQAEADRLRGIEGREAELFLIEQQIEALGRLKNSEVAKPKLQAQAREWENFSRDIERSLTDALMRSFESGDSFGKAFAKNLENTFKAMILKFAVQMTVGTAMNAIGLPSQMSLIGGTGGVGGASGGSSTLGAISNANSAYNLYNNGQTAAGEAAINGSKDAAVTAVNDAKATALAAIAASGLTPAQLQATALLF